MPATKTKNGPKTPSATPTKSVVPLKPSGKEETRLFQRGPEMWAWLTKEQAKDENFYWNDNPV